MVGWWSSYSPPATEGPKDLWSGISLFFLPPPSFPLFKHRRSFFVSFWQFSYIPLSFSMGLHGPEGLSRRGSQMRISCSFPLSPAVTGTSAIPPTEHYKIFFQRPPRVLLFFRFRTSLLLAFASDFGKKTLPPTLIHPTHSLRPRPFSLFSLCQKKSRRLEEETGGKKKVIQYF